MIDAVVLFAIIIVSKWTLVNNVPRRYFTCTYVSLGFTLVLIFDNMVLPALQRNVLKSLVLGTVVIGGIGTIYNLKYISLKSLTPMVDVVSDFKSLGNIGVISEYWNSYITSCVDPASIKATPHDTTGALRSSEIVDEVFQQKNIYVIKDMWFKVFPDTMTEFGHVLLKDGLPFKIGGCDVCKYKKL